MAFELTDDILEKVLKTREEKLEIDTVDFKVTSTLRTVQRWLE